MKLLSVYLLLCSLPCAVAAHAEASNSLVQEVYTQITSPGSGATYAAGVEQIIPIKFGFTLAGIPYCVQVAKAPDYNNPISNAQVDIGQNSYDLRATFDEDTSYSITVTPCDSSGLHVHAGRIGVTTISD